MLNRLSLRTIFDPNGAPGGIANALRYGTSLAIIGIAEVLFRIVSGQIEPLPPFIIFYPVLVVVCVFCGLGPALLALALCALVGVSNGVGALALGIFIVLNLAMFAVLRKLGRTQHSEAIAHSQMQGLLEKTQAEREWYSLVLRSIAEEVYFTDIDGRYRYANHAVLNE
ncbi:MAG TPA: hypothetical protein VFS24_02250, partial [Steroidobacteraceae bacterium]|nr:hypothetical protein [Steroidobacteraceae bacterium]